MNLIETYALIFCLGSNSGEEENCPSQLIMLQSKKCEGLTPNTSKAASAMELLFLHILWDGAIEVVRTGPG